MRHLIALQTILFKEFLRFMRIWPQTLLPPAVTTSLYFLIFGRLIGERIGEMRGLSYIAYIVPGVILMSVITNAYSNVVSSFYSTKFQRHIEELLIAPVPSWVILTGYVGGGVMRGILVGSVVAMISYLFCPNTWTYPWIVCAVCVLTATVFSLAGFLNALFANSFDDISIIPNFVLTPLVYLGGVFYSVTLLPEPWHSISLANPILYMVSAFRYGMLGISDVDIIQSFAIIGGFILILVSTSLVLLHKGIGLKT